MDALSRIIDDIRLTGVEFFYLAGGGQWGFRLSTGGLGTFHLILQGDAFLELDGQTPIPLHAWDMVLIPAGLKHRVYSQRTKSREDFPELNLEFHGHRVEPVRLGEPSPGSNGFLLCARFCFDVELSRPLVSALPPVLLTRGLSQDPPDWLRVGLEFLGTEATRDQPGRQTIINRVGDILFVECLREHLNSLPTGAGGWLQALRDPALSGVLSAMHGAPGQAWTVPELAGIACLSRSAFAERFSKIMGQPPLSYLAEHRMRLAAWQLRHSQQPVCRIAEMVGYASENAFGQAFKRAYGLTPSLFRAEALTVSPEPELAAS